MDLYEKIRTLPTQPGVYLYKNAEGEVIYVGKANNLRSRVRSYLLEASQANAKTGSLMREAVDIEYHPRRQRARSPRARKQSHQAAQAALQHPAARRQDLPLRQAHPRRPLPQGLRHAPPAQRRRGLLRPLLPRQPRLSRGRAHPSQLSAAQLQGRSLALPSRAPACSTTFIAASAPASKASPRPKPTRKPSATRSSFSKAATPSWSARSPRA